jgi:ABC-2 type transport system ATP-binding protein/lipopolysaccharide transport system ATP-binding protein
MIRLENVEVRYRTSTEGVVTFKDYVIRLFKRQIQRKELVALKDVSLEVKSGEVVGVIGRNGAGKSTLLGTIARIIRPTEGRVRLWGNVAPLLKLGAGFSFDLTGRENILLNGAVLGFSQAQMIEKTPDIIAFSGLKDFIDAPIRTYSSGMVLRLAFAVATAFRPDILLVDEVLAVGDQNFKEKCMDRIHGYQEEGATIVLVSHDMAQVQELCNHAIWIERGEIMGEGEPPEVVEAYRVWMEARQN